MHEEIQQINYLLDKRLMLNNNQIHLFRRWLIHIG
jgi:hypothetical protein